MLVIGKLVKSGTFANTFQDPIVQSYKNGQKIKREKKLNAFLSSIARDNSAEAALQGVCSHVTGLYFNTG